MVKYHLMYKNIKKETIATIQEHWKLSFWRGDEQHKKEVFDSLLSSLCNIYGIKKIPNLIIDDKVHGMGCYIPFQNKIIMNKYSLITFLHEFKHIKDFFEGKRGSEDNARGWSLSVMYQVNPFYLRKIVAKGKVSFLALSDIEITEERIQTKIYCPFCLTIQERNGKYCSECGTALNNS